MTEPIDMPPEFECLADLLSAQAPHVLTMIDDEKARVIGTRAEHGQE